MFFFGLFTHLTNFGIDQSYVQRYITARDDREAAKSIWITAILYMPVAAIFFFIGTGLFVFYRLRPELLGDSHRAGQDLSAFHRHAVAARRGGAGGGGDLCGVDGFESQQHGDAHVLRHLSALLSAERRASGSRCGCCTWRRSFGARRALAVAIAMIRVFTALDAWWNLAGMFSGGVLGLFLLGLICRRGRQRGRAIARGGGRAGDCLDDFAELAGCAGLAAQSAACKLDHRGGDADNFSGGTGGRRNSRRHKGNVNCGRGAGEPISWTTSRVEHSPRVAANWKVHFRMAYRELNQPIRGIVPRGHSARRARQAR